MASDEDSDHSLLSSLLLQVSSYTSSTLQSLEIRENIRAEEALDISVSTLVAAEKWNYERLRAYWMNW